MHARLALALFVSIALVGGALWTRLSNNATVKYELALVEPGGDSQFSDYFGSAGDIRAAKTIPKTELLGQQLILEYMALATNGQASDDAVAALAEKYVDSIPTLTQTKTVSYEELKIVTNNKKNFEKYASEITEIHKTYVESVERNYSKSSLDTLDSAFYSATSDISGIYGKTASELKSMAVPSAIATLHLELINTYLMNAESMRAISGTENDSTKAFAGLIALSNNTDKEAAVLLEISRVLNENGI